MFYGATSSLLRPSQPRFSLLIPEFWFFVILYGLAGASGLAAGTAGDPLTSLPLSRSRVLSPPHPTLHSRLYSYIPSSPQSLSSSPSRHRPRSRPCPDFYHRFIPLLTVCVRLCKFVELHRSAQSGPVILVILCHSHWSSQGGINDIRSFVYENL